MKIAELPPDSLTPYPQNAKIHSEDHVKGLAESIRQFGFVQPIVIDKNKEIIIGHGRWQAAKLLNMQTVPTVAVESLTKDQIKALRILDNKLNESPWDDELLRLELDSIELDFKAFNVNFYQSDVEEIGGKELSPEMAEGVEICTCATCGHEHTRK